MLNRSDKWMFVALTLGLLQACQPPGDNQRTIHPISKGRSSDEITASKNKSSQPLTRQAFEKGLPEDCQLIKTETRSCISCQIQDQPEIKRCTQHDIDPTWIRSNCNYNPKFIKCLSKEPVIAMSVNLKFSKEREFLLSFDTILETLSVIIKSEISNENERRRAITLLNILKELNETSMFASDFVGWENAWQNPDIQAKANNFQATILIEYFKQSANNLRQERWQGELSSTSAIRLVRRGLEATSSSEKILNIVNKLALEGLHSDF